VKPTAARITALNVLRAIRSGDLADRAFAHSVDQLEVRERPWLHELVYGTLRLRGRLDFILEQFVKRGTASLEPDVLDILRLGTYQLLEMNSVPAYAAVSQSVELAKLMHQRAVSGLVNGVLQSIRRAQAQLQPQQLNSIDALTDWGSHPRWLVERWAARFGIAATARLVDANNQRPELCVRSMGIDADGAIAVAATAGITLQPVSIVPGALKVVQGSVQELLANAPVIVQDPAAGLVVQYVSVGGGVVADLCAAPGGKAIGMADQVRGHGIVIASDAAATRLQRALDNVRRLARWPSPTVPLPLRFLVADARQPAIKSADVVLLDAPCTGTGTLRRHPDGKWRITSDDLRTLTQLQSDMLDAATSIVRVGGVLVYATCSLEPEENQEQVSAFLDRHPNFLRRPPADWHAPELIDEVGNLVVLPHELGFDGAFAARLERVA
jgi:16S rRNA (cytosine967-C5)-methyltransferase